MTAAIDVAANEPLSIEYPMVRGRAVLDGCPGCSESPCVGRFSCVWGSHVVGNVRLENAVLWHQDLCAKSQLVPDGPQRANHDRVVCLLAMVIQACASQPLLEWLLTRLRPMSEDPLHPLVQATAGFGERFAMAISPPLETADERRDERQYLQRWIAHERLAPADRARFERWAATLTRLLANLQTNLFYLDDKTIGMYRDACQLQHSCRPNASVTSSGDASLVVRALRAIRKGEGVSFCYLSDHGPMLCEQLSLPRRRQLLEEQAGFFCQCEVCVLEASIGGLRST